MDEFSTRKIQIEASLAISSGAWKGSISSQSAIEQGESMVPSTESGMLTADTEVRRPESLRLTPTSSLDAN